MLSNFRDLKVYQKAYQVSLGIHEMSLKFPQFEKVELGNQIRRASKSIAMNIAEGFGRRGSVADFKRFLVMALGSCDEIRVQLDYCRDLSYITENQYEEYSKAYDEIGRMLKACSKDGESNLVISI
jgi:four helix bundle protein